MHVATDGAHVLAVGCDLKRTRRKENYRKQFFGLLIGIDLEGNRQLATQNNEEISVCFSLCVRQHRRENNKSERRRLSQVHGYEERKRQIDRQTETETGTGKAELFTGEMRIWPRAFSSTSNSGSISLASFRESERASDFQHTQKQ